MPSGSARATSAPRVSREEEEKDDEEEEEDGDGRKKDSLAGTGGLFTKKRAPNFGSAEDATIARCWRILTNDPKTGTDQTSDVFWQRLFVKFTTVMMEEQKTTQAQINEHRSWKTLRSRWRRCIQKECMLFGSIYRRVRGLEKSGWNEDDYTKEAQARYRAMNGKNKEFAYYDCWIVLKDEPKFQVMLRQSKSPSDDEVPAIISATADTGNRVPEGDASSVTSVSEATGKQVRKSAGSYSSINGPPIGASGRPIGTKKAKAAALASAISIADETNKEVVSNQQHDEVTDLLLQLGHRMNHLAKRIDVQSSFLGSFVFLQMGDRDKAHAMADSGRTDLLMEKKDEAKPMAAKGGTVATATASLAVAGDDDDFNDEEEVGIFDDEDDDDSVGVGKENKKQNSNVEVDGTKRKNKEKSNYQQRRKERKTVDARFGFCCAGRRCGRFEETGGALNRMNFSPNVGDDIDEIIDNPKHRCTGCCQAFCGGTCGIGESADDFICNACLSMP